MSLSVVTFFWRDGPDAPYTSDHVAKLAHSVRRQLAEPHDFYCVCPDGQVLFPCLDTVMQRVQLPAHLPGWSTRNCRKLWIWSPEAFRMFGPRVLLLDLDLVLTGPIDPLIATHPFAMFEQREARGGKPAILNSSVLWLGPEAPRADVWAPWADDPRGVHRAAKAAGYVGSDQAVANYLLRDREVPVWTSADGIRGYKYVRGPALPAGTRIVSFFGPFNPSEAALQEESPWIAEHWR